MRTITTICLCFAAALCLVFSFATCEQSLERNELNTVKSSDKDLETYYKDDITELETELNRIERLIAEDEASLRQYMGESEKLYEGLLMRSTHAHTRSSIAENITDEAEYQLSIVEARQSNAKEKLEQNGKTLISLRNDVSKLGRDFKSYKKRADIHIANAKTDIKKIETNNHHLRGKIRDLQKRIRSQNEEANHLPNEIEDLERRYRSLGNSIRRAKEERRRRSESRGRGDGPQM